MDGMAVCCRAHGDRKMSWREDGPSGHTLIASRWWGPGDARRSRCIDGRVGVVMNDTVLVIDDDADTLARLTTALDEAGFAVTQATSGPAGRRRLEEGGIAVVLLDYRLPGEDGVTCLQAIVRRHPGLPVVMM